MSTSTQDRLNVLFTFITEQGKKFTRAYIPISDALWILSLARGAAEVIDGVTTERDNLRVTLAKREAAAREEDTRIRAEVAVHCARILELEDCQRRMATTILAGEQERERMQRSIESLMVAVRRKR